jgi:hypothetical protein
MITLLLIFDFPEYDEPFVFVSFLVVLGYIAYFCAMNGTVYVRIRRLQNAIFPLKQQTSAYEWVLLKAKIVYKYQLMDLKLDNTLNYYYHLFTFVKKTTMICAAYYGREGSIGMDLMLFI